MSEQTQNEAGNSGGSVTVGLPTFDFENTRRDLIALRVKHGADSAIGHRCSNIVEMLKNGVSPVKQVAQLERLLANT